MKRKELTKTFIMISNCNNPSVSIVCTETFQRCKKYFCVVGLKPVVIIECTDLFLWMWIIRRPHSEGRYVDVLTFSTKNQ